MFAMAMWMALLVALAPLLIGDLHGLNTLAHQPQKVAAMEGYWETRTKASLVFWSFRVMVGLGLAMIALGLASAWLRWRGQL
jgi:cytochrome d ubiquinol oxidase subunit I